MNSKKNIKKKLYRNTDDVIIAGVASGLAIYYDVDPVFIRIGFVCSVFLGSLGFWVYLILWIVMKKADTSLRKKEMYGKI